MSTTVYEIITTQIIAQLEKGVVSWRTGLPKNLISGKVYRGINLFRLSMVNEEHFVTRKQDEELGGRIRCKGFPVVFWKMLERETQKSGEIERIPLLRYYKVYPVSGVDGLEVPATNTETVAPIDAAEDVVRTMTNPPAIRYGGRGACYFPSRDEVQMPEMQSFIDGEEFYSTLFHELAHSTGHETRLDCEGVTTNWAFGSHYYSDEELIAEMTSSFLCGFAGIGQKTMPNSAAGSGSCKPIRGISSRPARKHRRQLITSFATTTKTPVDPGFSHVCMLSCFHGVMQTCFHVSMFA
jgi:antirestriction protein ArdC